MEQVLREDEMKKSIWVGIISSGIFLVVVQPILTRLVSTAPALAGTVLDGYLDYLIRGVALGPRDISSMALLSGVVSVAMGFTLGAIASVRRMREPSEPLPSAPKNTSAGARIPILRRRMYLGLVLLWLPMGHMVAYPWVVMQFNNVFDQRLSILAPLLTEDEEEIWRARWASMRTWEEYTTLHESLDAQAKERGVAFPVSPGAAAFLY